MSQVEIDSIISNIKVSCIKIANLIADTNPLMNSKVVSTNFSNDNVKNLDIITNNFMIEELSKNKFIKALISEENDDILYINNSGKYLVAFDPLDGSSNIDCNITIGTIFAIYSLEHVSDLDSMVLGETIVSAGYCLYGGSTQLIVADKHNVNLLLLQRDESQFKNISILNIPDKGGIYAINESNKHRWNLDYYNKLVEVFMGQKYTQRWVGSLVADTHRPIIKGGYLSYPSDSKSPNGRLRLLYEAIPMCFIIETAGGKAFVDETLKDWRMATFPSNIHVKTPLSLMSQKEYELLVTCI